MKYYVKVGEAEHVAELSDRGLGMDERAPLAAELAKLGDAAEHHLRLDGRGYVIAARPIAGGWSVLVGGRWIDVLLEDERSRAIREMAGLEATSVQDRDLRAPMPGLIVRVLVVPGQSVSEGDGLVIIEAMKMENELRADADRTVASVEVREGDAVKQNDTLVVFHDQASESGS